MIDSVVATRRLRTLDASAAQRRRDFTPEP
jgi:hypothetical protein